MYITTIIDEIVKSAIANGALSFAADYEDPHGDFSCYPTPRDYEWALQNGAKKYDLGYIKYRVRKQLQLHLGANAKARGRVFTCP